MQCDGLEQCPNGLDERNCPESCGNEEYFCSTERRCIPETWKCDGKSDCLDDEDEKFCDCPSDSFKCNTGLCIPMKYSCDGTPHCADLSDEWGCSEIHKPTDASEAKNLLKIKTNGEKFHNVCADKWNSTYGESVCKSMGYSGLDSWTTVPNNATTDMYYHSITTTGSLPSMFKLEDECETGLVQIKCMENSK